MMDTMPGDQSLPSSLFATPSDYHGGIFVIHCAMQFRILTRRRSNGQLLMNGFVNILPIACLALFYGETFEFLPF